MKKLIFFLSLTILSACAFSQDTKSLPYWKVMLTKSAISGTDSCAVFDNATLKWKKTNCSKLGDSLYVKKQEGNVLFTYYDASSFDITNDLGGYTKGSLYMDNSSLQLAFNEKRFEIYDDFVSLINVNSGQSLFFPFYKNTDTLALLGDIIDIGDSLYVRKKTGNVLFDFAGSNDVTITSDNGGFSESYLGLSNVNATLGYGNHTFNSQFDGVNMVANAVGRIDMRASTGLKLTDSRAGALAVGFVYNADYSANYTARSLVDKAYTDTKVPKLAGTVLFDHYASNSLGITTDNGVYAKSYLDLTNTQFGFGFGTSSTGVFDNNLTLSTTGSVLLDATGTVNIRGNGTYAATLETSQLTAVRAVKFPDAAGTIAVTLTNTATLDFGSTAAGDVSELTITVTGAVSGDVVTVGAPAASVPGTGSYYAYVSAADTVTVRYVNNSLTLSQDPASGTFRVSVIKY